MITIFTTAKPFLNEIDIIQRNAISSWKRLLPDCEIILFGNDEGAETAARDLAITYIPEIRKNEYGTPLVSDIFEKAQIIAKNKILAYVNADIILMDDFLKALSKITLNQFLMVGRRWDVDIKEKINFQNPDWQKEIRGKIEKEGVLHGPSGIDYFVFPKGVFGKIPEFALGRTMWDSWLLYNAWISGIPAIDATRVVTIAHQNHKVHVPKKNEKDVWKGPEAKINQKLAGGISHGLTIRDASMVLTENGLEKPEFNFYRFFSGPFRYYDKIPFLRPILFFGWAAILLRRKKKVG